MTTAEKLSPAMRLTLRAVVAKPGRLSASYPGGIKSVRALERRDMIRSERVDIAGVEGIAYFPTQYGMRIAWGLER